MGGLLFPHRYCLHPRGEYLRTRQTIAFVAEAKGLVALVERRINEIDIGVIEEMTDREVEEQYPEFWAAYHRAIVSFACPAVKRI